MNTPVETRKHGAITEIQASDCGRQWCGGTVRLPRLIGMGHAMDLILTGRKVEAPEALQMGLCNRVVPKGEA